MEQPLSPPARSNDRMLIGLVAGGLVLASLGAGAGYLLRGSGNETPAPAPVVATAPAVAADPAPLAEPPRQAAPAPAPAPVAQRPAAQPRPAPGSSQAPAPVEAQPQTQAPVYSSRPPVAADADRYETRRVATCESCGTIESVQAVQQKGTGSGVGGVVGGVVGGALGNRMGGGSGRTAMTVLGAIGGGLAGNEIEKRTRTETVYEVRVRLDDGTRRTLVLKEAPATGARVVVEGSNVRAVSAADTAPRTYRTNGSGA